MFEYVFAFSKAALFSDGTLSPLLELVLLLVVVVLVALEVLDFELFLFKFLI